MSLRTNSRMPASTSDTAARSLSTSGVSSICSGRMVAFIGNSSVSLSGERGSPPHDEVEQLPSALPILAASCPICGNDGSFSGVNLKALKTPAKSADLAAYQLRLNPALRLLLAAPDGVSPIEPEMVTPSNSFCSAPTLRSHLSSEADRVWPAIRLVPVSAMLSLADWSVSWLRAGWLTM